MLVKAATGRSCVNTLRPRRNGQHFPDDSFKHIFFNENVWISLNISLKFVPKGPINNIPALVQIMAWRRPGVKPLSEPMMVNLLTHVCVTRPQWVKVMRTHKLSCITMLVDGLATQKPGHKQSWYWPCSHGMYQLENGWHLTGWMFKLFTCNMQASASLHTCSSCPDQGDWRYILTTGCPQTFQNKIPWYFHTWNYFLHFSRFSMIFPVRGHPVTNSISKVDS